MSTDRWMDKENMIYKKWNQTQVSFIAGRRFNLWATREAQWILTQP